MYKLFSRRSPLRIIQYTIILYEVACFDFFEGCGEGELE